MRQTRVQNRICRSRGLLPVCAVLALALWCLPLGQDKLGSALGFVACALTAYVLAELCNSNSLFRVYTRSASSLFIVSAATLGFLHTLQAANIAAFFLAASMYLTFGVDRRSSLVVDTFHILFLLGVACLFVPQLVVLIPFYYICVALLGRPFSLKTFTAGIVGLVLAAGAALTVCYLTGRLDLARDWWEGLTGLSALSVEGYLRGDLLVLTCWAIMMVLALWCGIYYLSNRTKDKIRVRARYLILFVQVFLLALAVALQPQYAHCLLGAMMVSLAPIVAHYFTLSSSWLCAGVFFLTLLLLCAVAVLTLALSDLDVNDGIKAILKL
ncbi:MAG: hypothetical protein LUC33_07480 [Prevotellaceae bacterium]|nr:hypothetical protein [Prevotellaceae bacterium]